MAYPFQPKNQNQYNFFYTSFFLPILFCNPQFVWTQTNFGPTIILSTKITPDHPPTFHNKLFEGFQAYQEAILRYVRIVITVVKTSQLWRYMWENTKVENLNVAFAKAKDLEALNLHITNCHVYVCDDCCYRTIHKTKEHLNTLQTSKGC